MHNAIICRISALEEIPGADRVQVGICLGERVVIGKDSRVGDIGVLFPADLQLSAEYCHFNNLFRDSEKNSNPKAKGFFESNRRVRVQKFLNTRSEAYFAGLESLAWTGAHTEDFSEGDQFDTLNGFKLCEKYISEASRKAMAGTGKKKERKVKPTTPLFHEHVDSDHFLRAIHTIPEGARLSFTAKIHGSSHRSTCTLVRRPPVGVLGFLNKIALSASRASGGHSRM